MYQQIIRNTRTIIALFHYLYYLIFLFWLISGYLIFTKSPYQTTLYQIGIKLGRTALVLLGVAVMPGILGRLGIEIKITRAITVFRRQIGILVFLLAFVHYNLIRFLPIISGQRILVFPLPYFEIAGFSALTFLFLMFLTSNNLSVKRLGKWWKRLHRVVYIVVWLLVLHTGLQRVSIWTYFIGVFAVLETGSLIYNYLKNKQLA